MWFIDKRIEVICNQLKVLAIVKKEPIKEIEYKKGRFFYPEDADANVQPWEKFDQQKMKWYGPDAHYWFRANYQVEGEQEGKTLRLGVRTQVDEWDDGKNPQFLLFLNKTAIQGLDMNHRVVHLIDHAMRGENYIFDLQAYTGTLHSEFNLFLEMQQVDLLIEQLYFDLLVPLQAFTRMEKDDKIRLDLETVLNNTINLLDLRTPYSAEFYTSVHKAVNYIEQALYVKMSGYHDVIASCIGHTHIDVAWWWTVEQTREKVARSFSTVLKLMDEYPNYKFMSSQPQLYVFLKERYPDLYEKVKAKVKEGRWEVEGGMWVEADTNLTSGESLVRQFLYGKRFFREEFGIECRELWLPDVFGYSGSLPQIMKKSGIDYFMTTKLSWNQVDKVPNDTFMWRGIDGSEVFTHLITTLGVGQSEDDFFTTYNGILHPDAIMGGWKRYQNKEFNHDILISYGYGDGGGGPTREMLETSKRMEKGIRGIPKVEQKFTRQYFDELYERVKDNCRLETWEGELYFEYHRGTYTSMARNKRANRKSEVMMMDAEFFLTLCAMKGYNYPSEELDQLWKTILLNQFHDILPGTSIKEVYEVTRKEYEEINHIGGQLIQQSLDSLCRQKGKITVFNTLSFDRSDVVSLPKEVTGSLKDAKGHTYPIQEGESTNFVYLERLSSKGYNTYTSEPEKSGDVTARISGDGSRFETPFYRVEMDQAGMFTSIYDKAAGRELVQEGRCANQFRMFEDKPIYYDNWDIDIFHTEKSWIADEADKFEWMTNGPVSAVLKIKRRISNSMIVQKISFYRHAKRIDFDTYVDWKDSQCLLKVEFSLDIHSDEAAFDIQFGNLKRKVHQNTSWDKARFESCGHKWVDLSEGHYGVSVLNDCKYGHSVKNGCVSLTLIKSGIEPNKTTDQEEHFFTYSLYPHEGSLYDGDTIREGYKLNYPSHVVLAGAPKEQDSFLWTDRKNVIVETVKMAEDKNGIIIRLYESENTKTTAMLTFGMDNRLLTVTECNLMEEPVEGEVEKTEDGFTFTIKPFEVKTYRVNLDK